MHSSRLRMNAVLIILTACLPVAPQAAPAQYGKLSLDQLRSLRKKAAWRKRRMIFNNDGDDVIYKARVPTAEALLAARTSPLLGSQVDTIFYSNSLCFGQALHNSQVMEPFTCREAMFKPNALPGLMAKGLDPIQVMVDFCHKQGIEIFWDMRMNDTHDSNLSSYGPYLLPKLKKEHPEYLVGAANKQPPFGTWSSVDYAQPEVRDLLFRFLEEVCRKFDVDGIEMDFFRHACFFKSVAHGSKASQAELDMMTDLVRRVRAMTEHEGLRRGRPILIAIRVPDCVDYSRGIGLDVERWLADGLVDILVGTGYFRLNRWEHLVELGHKHGVSVYPCLSDSRVRGETRFHRRAIESYRGRALNAWNAGADGIYIFNYFDPRGAIWRELGDPEALHRMDKLYFVTVRNGNPGRYLRNGRHCLHTPQLTPTEPMLVPPDRPQEVEINVGDDLAQALAAGLEPSVTFHLRTSGGSDVQATLNAATLRDPIANDDWLDFAVDPTLVRRGANRLAVLAKPRAETPGQGIDWTLEYAGDRLPASPWRKQGGSQCVCELRDGKLFLADRSTDGGTYIYYYYHCFIRPAEETVMEARLKPVSGWSSIMIENGVHGEEFQFFPDKVKARFSGPSFAMDTTDRFHTYRVVFKGTDFRLYVGGQLRIDGAGKLKHPAYNGRCDFAFGTANSGSRGESYWKYVKVHTKAKSLYDAVLSVRYRDGR